jgi:nucleotide-binding universal stress UspA family protein
MIDLSRVICGLDGSPESLEAARQSLAVAGDGGSVTGVAVWDPSYAMHAGFQAGEFTSRLEAEAMSNLRHASAAVPGIEPLLLRGREVAGLLAAAANREAGLIAVGIHGESRPAGALFGDVATGVIHHAPCSVLVARRHESGFPGPIVQPTDGSPNSVEAAKVAATLAARLEVPLTLVHVGDEPAAVEKTVAAANIGDVGETRVVSGSPHQEIATVAAVLDAGLVVTGSRGTTGIRALGSVSERVAHHAHCSVLVVRDKTHPDFSFEAQK